MSDIIFWSGFCFGIAIITGVYGVILMTILIVKTVRKKEKIKFCEECGFYDGVMCVCMTKCPQESD